MFRTIYIFIIIYFMLSNAIGFAESNKEPIKMPEGFEGVYLGMSISEFLKIRPNANVHPMKRVSENDEVDLTKPNQDIGEFFENDPLFDMVMLGSYKVRDGKLKNILLIWTCEDIKQIARHRRAFISSCIKRWGPKFQRKTIKQEPKTPGEYLAPLLIWQKYDIIITACYTPKYYDEKSKLGGFSIEILPKSDYESSTAYVEIKTDPQTTEKLFEDFEEILKNIRNN